MRKFKHFILWRLAAIVGIVVLLTARIITFPISLANPSWGEKAFDWLVLDAPIIGKQIDRLEQYLSRHTENWS